MGKINKEQDILSKLDSYHLNEFVEHSFKLIKGRTPEEKAGILKQFSIEAIMAGYHKGLLRNVFNLLPEEYKNDEELVFVACLYDDDISSRSDELKHNHEFNLYLVANTINAAEFIEDKVLYENGREILLALIHEHMDSFYYVPKKYQNANLIQYYLSCNSDRIKNAPDEDVFYLLTNMTSQFKGHKALIESAASINVALLYSFDKETVSKYLAQNDELFSHYLDILFNRMHKLGEELKDFFSGECTPYTDEIEYKADKYYATSKKIQELLEARNNRISHLEYEYSRRRRIEENNKNKIGIK